MTDILAELEAKRAQARLGGGQEQIAIPRVLGGKCKLIGCKGADGVDEAVLGI